MVEYLNKTTRIKFGGIRGFEKYMLQRKKWWGWKTTNQTYHLTHTNKESMIVFLLSTEPRAFYVQSK